MSDTPDLSMLFQMMKDNNIDISSFMQNAGASNNHDAGNLGGASSSNIDMETMMKFMNIINSVNSSNSSASANLLYALKPFLRDSKKEKIDQYATFIKMSSVLSEMNKSGGDKF